jgi:hypothetical protein
MLLEELAKLAMELGRFDEAMASARAMAALQRLRHGRGTAARHGTRWERRLPRSRHPVQPASPS